MKKDEKGMAYVYPITEKLKEVTRDIFMPIIDQLSREKQAPFERFGYAWASQFMTYLIKLRKPMPIGIPTATSLDSG